MPATNLHTLVTRGIFGDDDNDVCRSFSEDSAAEPITGHLSFHHLITYIAAGAMGVCCIATFLVILGHIFNYRQPRLQKQLIRMITIMPVFAIFCFFGVLSYHLTNYFLPIAELYEAFALIAVFFYLIALLTPNATNSSEIFAFFAAPENGGSRNFHKTWIAVMQLLPGRFITTIAIIIVNAVDCYGAENYKRAHTIIAVINAIQTAITVIAVIRFLKKWIGHLKIADDKIVAKLFFFKAIVIFELVQNLIFKILSQTSSLNGTRTLSYNDLNFGLPALILTLEAMVFGLGMVWAYSHGQFRHRGHHVETGKDGQPMVAAPKEKMNPLRAVLNAIDLLDVFAALYKAFKLFHQRTPTSRSHAAPTPAYTPEGQSQHLPQQPHQAHTTYQAYTPPARGY